jgi:hypothetical protein
MRAKKNRTAQRPIADALAPQAALSEVSALLALAAPAIEPPARVKEQLLARVRSETLRPLVPAAIAGPAGWRFGALDEETGWVQLPFPGVKLRELTVDAARDTALLYVEMRPGTVFPDHEHTAPERGLVLTGDLVMDGRRLGAGDFYEAAAGTRHERISSPAGCTGLLWVGAEAWRKWRAAMAASR